MAQPVIQYSFHAGEWAPALNARVDLQKYHSGAATMRNFFVDYRGGASSRPGTKYVLQAFKSSTPVRLIPFSANFSTTYILEFGDLYVRFHSNGSPVLEATKAITGATKANPCEITAVGHGYSTGDWVYIASVGGMTQLNGKYYIVTNTGSNTFTLKDLFGNNVNSTSYTTYTTGGTAARVYTLTTTYAASDLALLKYAQQSGSMILTHTGYLPRVLTLIAANNWTIANITFGATITAPTISSLTVSGGTGTGATVAYMATAVNSNNEESAPSAQFTSAAIADISSTTKGSYKITLSGSVSGALYYNFYKAVISYSGAMPSGQAFGFVGFSESVDFIDDNISPDFSSTPPFVLTPFVGGAITSVSISQRGNYNAIPTVTAAAAPAGGTTAALSAVMRASAASVSFGGNGYLIGNVLTGPQGGVQVTVATLGGGGTINTVNLTNAGSYAAAAGSSLGTSAQPFTGGNGSGAQMNLLWEVASVTINYAGTGYNPAPALTFSAGTVTATATCSVSAITSGGIAPNSPTANGPPGVCAFYQQRLVLMGPTSLPQWFAMSQPGLPYNFNQALPAQADDAIFGSIVSKELNVIKSAVAMPGGLVVFTTRGAWQINGGASDSPVTPISTVAHAQSYVGASDVPPVVVNYDILYVQAKGSIVRDLSYNFYTNIFTGTDISVLSSHLFYGYTINEWAFAEEPFKVVWAIRSDGTALSLTFLKEQEIVGWAHHDTGATGLFKSVASVTESTTYGYVDAVYFVVQRTINSQTVQYIERLADRFLTAGVNYAWCVDAALQYIGTAATVFTGLDHLVGQTITGLADGSVIPDTVVAADGSVTLGTAASVVTIGLGFTCDLQTLRLDLGQPTDQGKRKKIPAVTVRVQDTLGLKIGSDTSNLTVMKDLVVGNVGSASNSVVTGLVTDDARTIIDPTWTVAGQYFIRQSNPFPATILGVIPEVTVGDTPK